MEQPAEQKPSNARRIADLCSVIFMCVCILAYLVLCIVFAGQAESIGAMLVLLLLWLPALPVIAVTELVHRLTAATEKRRQTELIGLVLSGALPFVCCLQKWLKKPLEKLGKKTGMTEVGITGFLLSAANNMAMFASFDKMKEKEQILNVAFAVCAAFVIGDHLAFTAANAPEAIAPMMAAKLISGAVAVLIALIFTRPSRKKA